MGKQTEKEEKQKEEEENENENEEVVAAVTVAEKEKTPGVLVRRPMCRPHLRWGGPERRQRN